MHYFCAICQWIVFNFCYFSSFFYNFRQMPQRLSKCVEGHLDLDSCRNIKLHIWYFSSQNKIWKELQVSNNYFSQKANLVVDLLQTFLMDGKEDGGGLGHKVPKWYTSKYKVELRSFTSSFFVLWNVDRHFASSTSSNTDHKNQHW